jgi:hypothetical protein
MYNTDFKVKYHDIKEELLKNKTSQQLESNSDPECEYSNQDVLDICNKLYRDELVSVFYADDIIDNKIDNGIKCILEKMILNNDFKLLVDELKHYFFNDSYEETIKTYFTQNSNFMIILTLFNPECFYILHKCICQQLTLGTIDTNLLDEIKKNAIDLFKTK